MKVLVTGGTGLIGAPVVRRLLENGHSVRLFSRHADEDAAQFEGEVEAWNGTVSEFEDTCGAAEGCDAIVHIAGIVQEEPPAITFESVNVGGTRHLISQAERSEVKKFIYVSSLGAERGTSPYHQSKRAAEDVVREFDGEWMILRPGNVYGPGDEVVTLLIRMVRTLPAVPVLDGGDQVAQPIWAGDLADAIVQCVERDELGKGIHEVAGDELTSTQQILDKLAVLLGKDPVRVPVPSWAAFMGTTVAKNLGIQVPFTPDQVTMMVEGNSIQPGQRNALRELFNIEPTPIDDGLRILVDSMPEQTPSQAEGRLRVQRYEVTIGGSGHDAPGLFQLVAENFGEVFRSTLVEPGGGRLELGETIDLEFPVRGAAQVRVIQRDDTSATVVTVQGHPLAGCVMFEAVPQAQDVLFRVRVFNKPASLADTAMMAIGGRQVQSATWEQAVMNVVTLCRGVPRTPIMSDVQSLEGEAAAELERTIEEMVNQWKHHDSNPARLI